MEDHRRKRKVRELYRRSRKGLWNIFVDLLNRMITDDSLALKKYPFEPERFSMVWRTDDGWQVEDKTFETPEALLFEWTID